MSRGLGQFRLNQANLLLTGKRSKITDLAPPSTFQLPACAWLWAFSPDSATWGKDEIRAKVITSVKFCKVGLN
jgi:hypothetical protein